MKKILFIICALQAITACQKELADISPGSIRDSAAIEAARDTITILGAPQLTVSDNGSGEVPAFYHKFNVFFHDTVYTERNVFRLIRTPGCVLNEAVLYIDGLEVQRVPIDATTTKLVFSQFIAKRILPEQEHTDNTHSMVVYVSGQFKRGEKYQINLITSHWVHTRESSLLPVVGLPAKGYTMVYRKS